MKDVFYGPAQQWEAPSENQATINSLLASEDALDKSYGEAYTAGCYIREFGAGTADPEAGLTAVGDLHELVEFEFRHGIELDQNDFTLGDCISFGTYPGAGDTRVERVRDGMRQVLEARNEVQDREALDEYGSFSENGYRVDALMPRNDGQPQQWTIRIYKADSEDVYREETIPMVYAPIFGVDVGDKALLEEKVEEIMRELA